MNPTHLQWLDSPSCEFDNFFQHPLPNERLNKIIKPLTIGKVKIPNNLVLAPMAGVTDGSFRLLCSRLGAGFTLSELASSKAIILRNRQTLEMIKFQGQVRPYAVQLFGADPEEMAQAAKIIESLNICDIIDINMGCPVPKVVKTGAGSALMKTPKLAAKILKSVSSAVSLPTTIKCRLGWSKESINVTDFVKCMLDNDAKAVTVHARTRQAGYSGEACWEYLQAPAAICGSVPFIANGDITSEQDVLKLHSLADCDGFMIGRGAVGKPWIFSELLGHRCFNDAEIRFKVFKHHLIDMLMEHGPKAAPLFRVHLFGYLKNHPNAAKARFFLCNERDPDKILLTGKKFFFNQPLAIFANTLQDLATNVD